MCLILCKSGDSIQRFPFRSHRKPKIRLAGHLCSLLERINRQQVNFFIQRFFQIAVYGGQIQQRPDGCALCVNQQIDIAVFRRRTAGVRAEKIYRTQTIFLRNRCDDPLKFRNRVDHISSHPFKTILQ